MRTVGPPLAYLPVDLLNIPAAQEDIFSRSRQDCLISACVNEGDVERLNTVVVAVVGRQGKTGDVKNASPMVARLAFLITGEWGFDMPPHVRRVHVILECINSRGVRVVKVAVGGLLEVYLARSGRGKMVGGRRPIARGVGQGLLTHETTWTKVDIGELAWSQKLGSRGITVIGIVRGCSRGWVRD
jgi:hypothetical protein